MGLTTTYVGWLPEPELEVLVLLGVISDPDVGVGIEFCVLVAVLLPPSGGLEFGGEPCCLRDNSKNKCISPELRRYRFVGGREDDRRRIPEELIWHSLKRGWRVSLGVADALH